jgi:hypothetical protein
MDVNVPRHLTESAEPNGFLDSENGDAKATAIHELASYVWENYVEYV